jgi:CRP-like cAMP-binding protein
MAKKLTLKTLKDEIAHFDPKLKEGEHGYTTYLILLASVVVGPNIKKIAKFTQIPREEVQKRGKNLRANGVWTRNKVACEWFEEHGGVAFIADSLVADGLVERRAPA